MLSIHPEYMERILDGTKQFEFRKRIPKEKVCRIVFYVTAPEHKVVGFAEVLDTITDTPDNIWEQTHPHGGISREKYDRYFDGCEKAHAHCLGEVTRFTSPRHLEEFGQTTAPQSFVYLESWGM